MSIRRHNPMSSKPRLRRGARCLLVSGLAIAGLLQAEEMGTRGPPSLHGRIGVPHADAGAGPVSLLFANPSGVAETIHNSGAVDTSNEFFQVLGTNGRTCETCHQARAGWSVTPASVQARFDATDGTDPIFRTNDGSNSPHADVATVEERRRAFSLLLTKGLIRIGLPIPSEAEFELTGASDPYGFASTAELSLFRRPLPATNLSQFDTVMWDGRETFEDAGSTDCIVGTATCFASHAFNLADQANGATVGHAQAAQPLTLAQRTSIVAFELGLATAQRYDANAHNLAADGARGGALALAAQPFYFGINDFAYGDYRRATTFDAVAFTLFGAWNTGAPAQDISATAVARRAIARGEALFNSRPFTVEGVAGFNDRIGVSAIQGTCSVCHNAPNSGSTSLPTTMDIGISAAARRTPDVPLYTLRNRITGETLSTTDPGRGLVTGRWDDVGKFKVPSLRALAARAPYFHDGSADDLAAVVAFYDQRFRMHLSADEASDLVAFLRAL